MNKRWTRYLLGALFGVLAATAPLLAQPITTEGVGVRETEAGNIVADAVRTAAGAEVGVVPAVAFRPGATAERPATAAQAARLLEPTDDAVVVLTLRGSQVLAALERSVSFSPQRNSGFLQVSGLRFQFDPRQPAGKRVRNAVINGQPLEAAREYRIGTTRPLATGQQGYFQIWEKAQITSDTGKTLTDALRDLAAARGGSLTGSVEGRIRQVE